MTFVVLFTILHLNTRKILNTVTRYVKLVDPELE